MGRRKASNPAPSAPVATVSVWTEGVTEPVQLCFHNKADCRVDINWLNYKGQHQTYSTLKPQGSYALSSFSTHAWVVSYEDGHSATYVGGSALLVVLPGGKLDVKPYQPNPDEDDTSWQDTAWGAYKQRGAVLGMPIMAYECVPQEAVQQVEHVVTHMLAGCHPDVLQRMVAARCSIAIIGRHQKTTDIPPHHFMKSRSNCEGARDIDATTRGLGATRAVPTTSCGEENITMVNDRRYYNENILIHELGHAVMHLGMDSCQLERVNQCYSKAQQHSLYDADCYMMENADEYWAEGCQSWFDATVRTDVNSGINTRDKLKQRDPDFALLLTEVFGDGPWHYPQTAPAAFGHKGRSPKQRQQRQKQQHSKEEPGIRRRQRQQTGINKTAQRHTSEPPRVRTRAMTTSQAGLEGAAAGGPAAAGSIVDRVCKQQRRSLRRQPAGRAPQQSGHRQSAHKQRH